MAKTRNRSKKDSVRILIVDDHPIVRQGLIQILQHEPDLRVCGEADNSIKALEAAEKLKPDLAIVDISLKESNGIELTKDMKLRFPKLPVLVLSMHDDFIYAERTLRAGARGYLMKDMATENVVRAVRRILAGEIYLCDKVAQRIIGKVVAGKAAELNSQLDCLTDRELEVLRLLGSGMGTRDIANRFHRSIKTIEAHRENIKRKLNLNTSTDLLQYAIQWARSESI